MSARDRPHGHPFDRHTFELWMRSSHGRRLLELEEREVARTLPELFGRHLLQIGSWGRGTRLLTSSQMLHSAVLGTLRGFDEQAVAEPERLPLLAKSVDAVLLPHSLEFVHSPQSVLREVNRVLTDRGRLLILGFNPWSFWGLRHGLGLRYRAYPPGARMVSVGRLRDWLELLDFEVCELRRFGVGFPWHAPHSEGVGGALQGAFDTLADVYLMVAKKRVIPMTLVGRRARAVVKPAIGAAPATEARRDGIVGSA